MNFDRLNFGRMSGASPSSSVSEGIMLQMSIFACSARDDTSSRLGITSRGPMRQCSPNSAGITIFIKIPAPFNTIFFVSAIPALSDVVD